MKSEQKTIESYLKEMFGHQNPKYSSRNKLFPYLCTVKIIVPL